MFAEIHVAARHVSLRFRHASPVLTKVQPRFSEVLYNSSKFFKVRKGLLAFAEVRGGPRRFSEVGYGSKRCAQVRSGSPWFAEVRHRSRSNSEQV